MYMHFNTGLNPGLGDSVGSAHRVCVHEIRVPAAAVSVIFLISEQMSFDFALIFGGFQMLEVEKCKWGVHLSAFETPQKIPADAVWALAGSPPPWCLACEWGYY